MNPNSEKQNNKNSKSFNNNESIYYKKIPNPEKYKSFATPNYFNKINESPKSSSNKNDDSGKKSGNFSAENIAPQCKNKKYIFKLFNIIIIQNKE